MIKICKKIIVLFSVSVLLFTGSNLFGQTIIVPNSNRETVIDSNKLTVYWKTFLPGDTKVEFGETELFEKGNVFDSIYTIDHLITINNLKPATVYYLRCTSKNLTGESSFSNWVVSTSSQYSKGTINVYFNKSINSKISTSEIAWGECYFPNVIINRIDSAKYSIDVCVYSFSGTVTHSSPYGVGSDIADALIRAKNRGIRVRFIMEDDNQNTSPVNKIKGAGIPFITDKFGKYESGALQHNKFFIFDARDSFTDTEAWVITGSWNVTNPGTLDDYQNIVEIQDKSLAKAFTLEFNEMWGSSTDQPDATNAKFGKYKADNTPHRFNLKGIPVELYFAPTDGVSYQVQNRIGNTESSIFFSQMTFTSDPIAQAISQRTKVKNIKIRGLINKSNLSDQGIEYGFLNSLANSIVLPFDPQGGIFHHKYFILDGDRPDLTPWVLTGSYNISASAESSNNENLIFIQSKRIANLYLQEFTQRYFEAGGKDTIRIVKVNNMPESNFKLSQNFPNPFNSATIINYSLQKPSKISLKIYNALGQEVQNLYSGIQVAGKYNIIWSPNNLPSGIYYYRMSIFNKSGQEFLSAKKMIYLK